MQNPFQIFQEDLSEIKNLLLELKNKPVEEPKSENLTVQEASELLKVSEQSIHNYIKKGYIPAKKLGRIYLMKREDIEASLKDVKSLKYRRD
jgi:excisionase family DNA binding protein